MSIETSPETIKSPEVEATEISDMVVSPDASEEVVDPAQDPEEPFEDWLARKNAPKEPPKVEQEPEDEKVAAPPAKEEPKESPEVEKFKLEAKQAKAEHAKLNKQAEQLVNLLKTDPGKILNKLGVNKEAIEEWYYKNHIEPDLLTPEQKQARVEKEELERYRANAAKQVERKEQERKEQLKERYKQEWSNRINAALDKSDLPKSDLVVSRIAYHMKIAFEQGNKHIQIDQVIPLVKKDIQALQAKSMAGMSPKDLKKLLGEETMAKLRAHDAEQYKQDKLENKKSLSKPRTLEKKHNKRYKNVYDLLDDL